MNGKSNQGDQEAWLVTYSEVPRNVGSSQNAGGCGKEDGEDRKECLFSEVWTHVLPHDGTWQMNSWKTNKKDDKANLELTSANQMENFAKTQKGDSAL